MLKVTAWLGALVVALLLIGNNLLASGDLLRYSKLHASSQWMGRRIPFWAGHFFYSVQNYEQAYPYFSFVAQNAPQSAEGQESAFYKLICGRLLGRVRQQDYIDFLDTYPSGEFHNTVLQYLDGSVPYTPSQSH